MALKSLILSLQFGDIKDAARHRAAIPRHSVDRLIRHALQSDAEITVRIVGLEEGQTLNRDYRQKDYATNVLTFEYTGAPLVTADLVLCAPVVASETKENKKTLRDHYAHLLVHGTLHAQGHDHELNKKRADAMEALEVAVLAGLGIKNPYL